MSAPSQDWIALPMTLRIRHLATIYGLKESSMRKAVRLGDPSVPKPFVDRPYRFRKADVQKHYERLELFDVRMARRRLRRHVREAVA